VTHMNYGIRKVETDDELTHHGITGMHWGIRRWQYRDGSLTPEGRKKYGSLRERISKWKEDKQRKKAEKNETAEQRRARLIERGSPAEIKKHIREFNGEELASIQRRFATELQVMNTMSELTGEKSKAAKTPISSVKPNVNYVKTVGDIAQTAKNTTENVATAYNIVATAHNIRNHKSEGDAGYMPVLRLRSLYKDKSET